MPRASLEYLQQVYDEYLDWAVQGIGKHTESELVQRENEICQLAAQLAAHPAVQQQLIELVDDESLAMAAWLTLLAGGDSGLLEQGVDKLCHHSLYPYSESLLTAYFLLPVEKQLPLNSRLTDALTQPQLEYGAAYYWFLISDKNNHIEQLELAWQHLKPLQSLEWRSSVLLLCDGWCKLKDTSSLWSLYYISEHNLQKEQAIYWLLAAQDTRAVRHMIRYILDDDIASERLFYFLPAGLSETLVKVYGEIPETEVGRKSQFLYALSHYGDPELLKYLFTIMGQLENESLRAVHRGVMQFTPLGSDILTSAQQLDEKFDTDEILPDASTVKDFWQSQQLKISTNKRYFQHALFNIHHYFEQAKLLPYQEFLAQRLADMSIWTGVWHHFNPFGTYSSRNQQCEQIAHWLQNNITGEAGDWLLLGVKTNLREVK